MEKARFKLLVDVLMFIDFILLAFSGFVLKFALPRGSGRLGASFILEREDWLSMHNITAIIITILIVIHLIMNWVWIKNMIKSLFVNKTKNNKK
jgi:cytochrome b subunit of formate dehydrogenase